MSKHYDIIWDDCSLSVTGPPNLALKNALTYTAKSLEQRSDRPWERAVKRRRERIFHEEKPTSSTRTYLTFQGVLDLVLRTLIMEGCITKLVDMRGKFPEPRLDRMHGFRFSQERLLRDALAKGRSGVVKAPTRYGKTAMICNTINAFPGMKIAIVAPGVDLLPQLESAVEHYCPGREVRGIYSGSRHRVPSDDVTVCSVDSIDKLDREGTRLVLVDEPHVVATGPRASALAQFSNARMLAFGATTEGRWEGNDIMITGLFGPVLSEITYPEAVQEGAICPIEVKFIRVPFKHFPVGTRATAYRKLHEHPNYLSTIREIDQKIPADWQTLFFISNERQGETITENVSGSTLAMAKLMKSAAERRELFERLKRGDINRCVCSNIYSTGVTIDGVRCAVNCAEGGANILSIQKPGRLAELKEGKRAGYMIDFLFEVTGGEERYEHTPSNRRMWSLVTGDCRARIESYRDKGYSVEVLDSVSDLELT